MFLSTIFSTFIEFPDLIVIYNLAVFLEALAHSLYEQDKDSLEGIKRQQALRDEALKYFRRTAKTLDQVARGEMKKTAPDDDGKEKRVLTQSERNGLLHVPARDRKRLLKFARARTDILNKEVGIFLSDNPTEALLRRPHPGIEWGVCSLPTANTWTSGTWVS